MIFSTLALTFEFGMTSFELTQPRNSQSKACMKTERMYDVRKRDRLRVETLS